MTEALQAKINLNSLFPFILIRQVPYDKIESITVREPGEVIDRNFNHLSWSCVVYFTWVCTPCLKKPFYVVELETKHHEKKEGGAVDTPKEEAAEENAAPKEEAAVEETRKTKDDNDGSHHSDEDKLTLLHDLEGLFEAHEFKKRCMEMKEHGAIEEGKHEHHHKKTAHHHDTKKESDEKKAAHHHHTKKESDEK